MSIFADASNTLDELYWQAKDLRALVAEWRKEADDLNLVSHEDDEVASVLIEAGYEYAAALERVLNGETA